MEYCAECQKAIDEALDKIPIKFRHEFVPIDEPLLLPVFQKIKSEEEKKTNDEIHFYRCNWTSQYCCGEYDNIDEYVFNGIVYRVEYNDDTPEDKHISIDMEYSIEEQKSTGKPWRTDKENRYRHGRNLSKDLQRATQAAKNRGKNSLISVQKMSPPTGRLFFNELEWDLKTEKSQKKKEMGHQFFSFQDCQDGARIKCDAKNGGYRMEKRKVIFDDGVNPEKLVNFIKYSYTVEGYDDENVIYYKNIHIE